MEQGQCNNAIPNKIHLEKLNRGRALGHPSGSVESQCSEVISTAGGNMPATLLIQSPSPADPFGSIGVSKAKHGLMRLQEEWQVIAFSEQEFFSVHNSLSFPDHVHSQGCRWTRKKPLVGTTPYTWKDDLSWKQAEVKKPVLECCSIHSSCYQAVLLLRARISKSCLLECC